jgi:hypothetical protein
MNVVRHSQAGFLFGQSSLIEASEKTLGKERRFTNERRKGIGRPRNKDLVQDATVHRPHCLGGNFASLRLIHTRCLPESWNLSSNLRQRTRRSRHTCNCRWGGRTFLVVYYEMVTLVGKAHRGGKAIPAWRNGYEMPELRN